MAFLRRTARLRIKKHVAASSCQPIPSNESAIGLRPSLRVRTLRGKSGVGTLRGESGVRTLRGKSGVLLQIIRHKRRNFTILTRERHEGTSGAPFLICSIRERRRHSPNGWRKRATSRSPKRNCCRSCWTCSPRRISSTSRGKRSKIGFTRSNGNSPHVIRTTPPLSRGEFRLQLPS